MNSNLRSTVTIALSAVLLSACTKPEFRNFYPSGAPFERSFAQLYDDGGTPKLSHYAILALTPADVRTPATGTIEYVRSFDEMGNCLLLRPKKYFSTDNDTSKLKALPKPGALVIALCNLDEAAVQAAVAARYTVVLSAGESAAATAQFIINDESFRTLDVEAHESDISQSTLLGSASGGRLYLAAFVVDEESGSRVYVNPLPYLAGAITPPSDLDTIPPTITSVILSTSANGTFDDAVFYTPSGAGVETVPGNVAADHLRVAALVNERSRSGAADLVPYGVRYELSRVTISSGSVVGRDVKSKGTALLNAFPLSAAATLAPQLYGSSGPATSDPAAGTYFVHIPWHGLRPPLDDEVIAYNGLQAPASLALDLTETNDGNARFPSGTYEIQLTAIDAVNPIPDPPHKTVRFDVSGSAAPGDGVLSYNPTAGPMGALITLTSVARGDAFINGNTTVEFSGTFDPDGQDAAGVDLPPTGTLTVTYPADKTTVIDGANLRVRVGAVLPSASVLSAPNLRYGRGGLASGTVRVRTPGAMPPFDHTVGISFRIAENVRFGRNIEGDFHPLTSLPVYAATTAADIVAAPDFERVDVEWRIPPEPGSPPPSAISVNVRTLSASGDPLDSRNLSLNFVGEDTGLAIYRSGDTGSRQMVFVTTAALAGEHGSDMLAVHFEPGGSVRLDGVPPP